MKIEDFFKNDFKIYRSTNARVTEDLDLDTDTLQKLIDNKLAIDDIEAVNEEQYPTTETMLNIQFPVDITHPYIELNDIKQSELKDVIESIQYKKENGYITCKIKEKE